MREKDACVREREGDDLQIKMQKQHKAPLMVRYSTTTRKVHVHELASEGGNLFVQLVQVCIYISLQYVCYCRFVCVCFVCVFCKVLNVSHGCDHATAKFLNDV